MKQKITKPLIRAIITDLDDTLWDWVDLWYHPFKAMLDVLIKQSGISEEELVQDIKKIFTKHRTTEYSFVIQEIECLQMKHPCEDLKEVYKEALEAFKSERSKHLALYPTVLETLKRLKQQGVLLIAYTESRSFYTKYRFRKFDLDLIFDYLYSTEDHDLPEDFSLDKKRYYDTNYSCRHSIEENISVLDRKPSPGVLKKITQDLSIDTKEVIYIGDKLNKDILMAKQAGVIDVWAQYGEAKDREEYELLRKVTHWEKAEVEAERKTSPTDITPTYILNKNLEQLFDYFDFAPFISSNHGEVIDIWKKSIDTQMHFNDIEIKIRGIVVSILLATFAAAGVAIRYNLNLFLHDFKIPLSSCLFGVSSIGVFLLWMMDYLWYHKLLYGAVAHALNIENRYRRNIPDLSLSNEIKKSSSGFKLLWIIPFSSKIRLCLFYWIIIIVLAISSIFTFVCNKQDKNKNPANEQSVQGTSVIIEDANSNK